MTTGLTDKEYELMRRYRGGMVPLEDDEETLNSLREREFMELHHQTRHGKTTSYYDLSFRGLEVLEKEKVRRSPVTSFLKSVFQI